MLHMHKRMNGWDKNLYSIMIIIIITDQMETTIS